MSWSSSSVGQEKMPSVPTALIASGGLAYSLSGYWAAMTVAIRASTCSVDSIVAR